MISTRCADGHRLVQGQHLQALLLDLHLHLVDLVVGIDDALSDPGVDVFDGPGCHLNALLDQRTEGEDALLDGVQLPAKMFGHDLILPEMAGVLTSCTICLNV